MQPDSQPASQQIRDKSHKTETGQSAGRPRRCRVNLSSVAV